MARIMERLPRLRREPDMRSPRDMQRFYRIAIILACGAVVGLAVAGWPGSNSDLPGATRRATTSSLRTPTSFVFASPTSGRPTTTSVDGSSTTTSVPGQGTSGGSPGTTARASSPGTSPPATAPPTGTSPETTSPPATSAPTTAPPATSPPTTVSPTTKPPATTPTTSGPTTTRQPTCIDVPGPPPTTYCV